MIHSGELNIQELAAKFLVGGGVRNVAEVTIPRMAYIGVRGTGFINLQYFSCVSPGWISGGQPIPMGWPGHLGMERNT